jgi:cation-transporting ATPase E
VDADFAEAAAALGGQSGLSVFVSTSAILLILLLEPPHRIFTAWNPVSPDRRPAWLALGLFVAFAAVLLIPATRSYFGLTAPDPPVVVAAGIAIVLWFVAVSLALRFRVLERVLGLLAPGPAAPGPAQDPEPRATTRPPAAPDPVRTADADRAHRDLRADAPSGRA